MSVPLAVVVPPRALVYDGSEASPRIKLDKRVTIRVELDRLASLYVVENDRCVRVDYMVHPSWLGSFVWEPWVDSRVLVLGKTILDCYTYKETIDSALEVRREFLVRVDAAVVGSKV